MSKHNYTLKDFKISDAKPEVTPLDDINKYVAEQIKQIMSHIN